MRRLYTQFEPSSYTLHLHPDKESMKFSGKVTIEGKKVGRPSKRIVFHANKLSVSKAKVYSISKDGKEEIKITRVVRQASFDEVRLHADRLLYPGKYVIELSFGGKITRPMEGLYPCFFEQNKKKEIILATQFESHHARDVFPCIDEPEAKAVFNLSLVAPKNEVTLSNTDIKSSKPMADGLVRHTFEPTPKMSSYLLAFVIGNIKHLESKTKTGVRVRTYARADLIKHTTFALESAVKYLDFFNEYFGIDYPLPKCDLVALPDFSSGAMENWGLITFREQGLIVDPKHTSLSTKQYVAMVVAHELTHQWFGNLVTMRWWNDLWLNESFASLMSYVAIEEVYPELKMWIQFMTDEQTPALKLDSLENTHPINVKINHPDEIRTIFDNISYEKGASILFMLMQYIGEEKFRDGLRIYLKKHAYSNTVSDDLWRAWEEVAHKPITQFMHTWTTTAGYPLLKVSANEDHVHISQERFYLSPRAKKVSPDPIWPLPILPSVPLDTAMLSKKTRLIKLTDDHKESFIINQGRSAFYRVVYDDKHLKRLAKLVKNKQMHELDRLGLVSDIFEATKAGLSDTVNALDLLSAYEDEHSVVVWEIIAGNIAALRTSVIDNDDALRQKSNPFIHKLIKTQYERLGWKEKQADTHFDKLLRPIILGLACASELPDALAQVSKLYLNRTKQSINPDLRGIVYATIAKHGDESIFNELVKMHNEADNSVEKLNLVAGITNFTQEEIIKKSLAMIISDDVRLQDVAYWISYSFSNRQAKFLTWEWLIKNWSWLETNMGKDLSFFMIPRYVARAFSDLSFLPDFENFFINQLSPSFRRPLYQAIETITWQALWKEREQSNLTEYF